VAYRFLFEVPESRVDEANVMIGSVPDAQVLLVRNPHGRGFGEPFVDLTVASHSLGVIGVIFTWYEELPDPKPEVGITLHSGERVALADSSRADMVRRIRLDQPWVETIIPKIGDHQRDVLPDSDFSRLSTRALAMRVARNANPPLVSPSRQLDLLGDVAVAVKVTDLGQAEKYYVDFLGMSVLGRERRIGDHEFVPVEEDYDHVRALTLGTEADVSFLANGHITLALDRVGRGARLARSSEAPVPISVTKQSFLDIKGRALIRGMEIDGDGVTTLAVRDIYGVVWAFTVAAAATVGQISA
jgi:hypothetical protein